MSSIERTSGSSQLKHAVNKNHSSNDTVVKTCDVCKETVFNLDLSHPSANEGHRFLDLQPLPQQMQLSKLGQGVCTLTPEEMRQFLTCSEKVQTYLVQNAEKIFGEKIKAYESDEPKTTLACNDKATRIFLSYLAYHHNSPSSLVEDQVIPVTIEENREEWWKDISTHRPLNKVKDELTIQLLEKLGGQCTFNGEYTTKSFHQTLQDLDISTDIIPFWNSLDHSQQTYCMHFMDPTKLSEEMVGFLQGIDKETLQKANAFNETAIAAHLKHKGFDTHQKYLIFLESYNTSIVWTNNPILTKTLTSLREEDAELLNAIFASLKELGKLDETTKVWLVSVFTFSFLIGFGTTIGVMEKPDKWKLIGGLFSFRRLYQNANTPMKKIAAVSGSVIGSAAYFILSSLQKEECELDPLLQFESDTDM